jgi:hypothetical protein
LQARRICKRTNRVIRGRGGAGQSVFVTDFVPHLDDHCHGQRAIRRHTDNSTRGQFKLNADFISLEQQREIFRMLAAELEMMRFSAPAVRLRLACSSSSSRTWRWLQAELGARKSLRGSLFPGSSPLSETVFRLPIAAAPRFRNAS